MMKYNCYGFGIGAGVCSAVFLNVFENVDTLFLTVWGLTGVVYLIAGLLMKGDK